MNSSTKKKIFDLILADALEECMDEKIKEFENLQPETPHIFSKKYEKKKKKIINFVGRKDRIKKYKRIAVKAGVTFSIAFSLICCGLLTQPEVYAAVQNVFRSVFDKYDKYEYTDNKLTTENFNDNIRLGYVPDDYYLSEGLYSQLDVTLVYESKVDQIILDYRIANGVSANYDNENNSYYEFTDNGVEYHYYESNDSNFNNILIWYEDGYSFSIFAHFSRDELVKIAENLKK